MSQNRLITTSIAYVNGAPHIGFAMELIEADAMARWSRARGDKTFFLTGTDEHGSKIYREAKNQNITPQEMTDRNAKPFQDLCQTLAISNDDFVRTTEARHKTGARAIWERIEQNGDLEYHEFEGLYCVGCETFYTPKELVDGKCPNHLTEPEMLTERNVFFKLSRYSEQIAELIESNTLEIVPDFRKNEILQFAKEGLKDISFSRPKSVLPWGIPVPNDPEQVMYVWCDALSNYLTAVGYGSNDDWQQYWQDGEVLHFIGKDILRFHAAIWPAMLLSAGLPLPKKICVHGFLTSEGHKMSKSLGNVVDPFAVVQEFGGNPDPIRFFLLSEVPFGRDADFSRKRFLELYNARLANGLGNLFARVITLANKSGATMPETIADAELAAASKQVAQTIDTHMKACELHHAIEAIFTAVEFLNHDIDRKKPWLTIKTEPEATKQIVADWLLALQQLAREVEIFLPQTGAAMRSGLLALESAILFPRMEIPTE